MPKPKQLRAAGKREKIDEVTVKGFQKVLDQISNLEDWIRYFEEYTNGLKGEIDSLKITLENQAGTLQKDIDTKVGAVQKSLETNVSVLQQDYDKKITELKKNLDIGVSTVQKNLDTHMATLQKTLSKEVATMQEKIKTQEEVFNGKFKEFTEQFLIDKNNIALEIQELTGQYDTMKVSITVSEKQLVERLRILVGDEIKSAVMGKEHELLVKYWIDELKGIMSKFDNLKKAHPKEFNLQLSEIADIIEIFRQRIKK